MKKILLLHPHNPLEGYHYPVPQVAFGYLSHAIKQKGPHQVQVLDAMLYRLTVEEVVQKVVEYRPDILGIRVWSHQVKVAEEYVSKIRKLLPNLVVIIGGPHITTDSTYDKIGSLFDFGVVGEAEEAIAGLVDYLEGRSVNLSNLPGLVWLDQGQCRKNSISKIDQLDCFDVDWDCLSLPEYHRRVPKTTAYDRRGVRNAFIFMTRGCPYPCTYCAAGLTNGKTIRSHSAQRVVDQMEYLYQKYEVRHFNLMDDNFTFYKETVMEFCEEFERRRHKLPGVSFHNPNGVRVDRLDREMLVRMKNCGWRWLHIGIESGSEVTLKRMKKRLNLELAKENIAQIRQVGLKCWGFFILGFDGETKRDIEQTIDWAVSSRLNAATFSLFSPIPGTEIFRELNRKGEIEPNYLMTSYMSAKMKSWAAGISPKELLQYQKKALLKFYWRPDRAFHLLQDMSPYTLANRISQLLFNSSGNSES